MVFSGYFQKNGTVAMENIDTGDVKGKIRCALNCGKI